MNSRFLYPIYFFSGTAALILELVWERQLSRVLGHTAYSSACVVAAFMAGIMLGSRFFGGWADRSPEKGLVTYGKLEAAIGVYALIFPALLHASQLFYTWAHGVIGGSAPAIQILRFTISFFILLIPTAAMGGTFPLLTRYAREYCPGVVPGALYGANLAGAVMGAFFSGFVLLGAWGVRATTFLAIVILFTIASVVRLGRPGSGEAAALSVRTDRSGSLGSGAGSDLDRSWSWILALSAVSGCGALALQMLWARLFSLALGSSVYALSAVLTVCLAGLGLGAVCAARMEGKGPFSLARAGWLQALSGMLVLVFLPLAAWVSYGSIRMLDFTRSSMWHFLTMQLAAAAATFLVPAFVSGLILPYLFTAAKKVSVSGAAVGRIYAWNAIGASLGAVLSVFVLIPCMGLQGSIQSIGGSWIAAGLAAVWLDHSARRSKTWILAVPLLAVSWAASASPWEKEFYSSGPFVYAEALRAEAAQGKAAFVEKIRRRYQLVFYKDGRSSSVSVLEYAGKSFWGVPLRSLRVNGKTDASNSPPDMITQLSLAYIPMLANPNARQVLVIGLGSGVTLSAVAQFERVERIECVEIEPAVVEAARWFELANRKVLSDPRTKLIIGDGRNHLTVGRGQYDVIISEPSNPWISGVSYLFTEEHYRAALERLSPEGVYCQWFHAYHMSEQDFVMTVRTFASVFPEVQLFQTSDADFLLLGSARPLTFAAPGSLADEVRSGLDFDMMIFFGGQERFFLKSFVASGRDVRDALGRTTGPVHTDDRLQLEYRTPFFLYADTMRDVSRWTYSLARRDLLPRVEGWDESRFLRASRAPELLEEKANRAFAAGNRQTALRYLLASKKASATT